MRSSGLDIIGDVPWGSHFCQFHEDQQDPLDTLVPRVPDRPADFVIGRAVTRL